MPNKILVATNTTPIVFADTVDYEGDGGNFTHQITLEGLVGGAARQSDKADMDTGGVTNRFPRTFAVTVRLNYDAAPAEIGTSTDIYWASSVSSVAAIANPGGVTGSDSAYTGTAGSTLGESLKDLQFLGPLMLTFDGSSIIQQATFLVTLPTQYGTLVVVNDILGEGILANPGVNLSVTFTPRELEAQ